jgi:DnaK suppressor protein
MRGAGGLTSIDYLPPLFASDGYMTTTQAKERLLAREQELLRDMRRLGDDAREAKETEVEDPIDAVASAENQALNFRMDTVASEELGQVQAALQRIEEGTYGTCLDCGRSISDARLEALPWTPYCVEDSEKHQRESAAKQAYVRTSSE